MPQSSPHPQWRTTDTFDDLYKVPIIRSESAHDLFHDPEEIATFAVPIEEGPDLRFIAQPRHSARLRVVFHGAVSRERDRYPRYDRVTTLRRSGEAFISFADPSLLIDESITLGWYTGARSWDPVPLICAVIKRAQEVSGAEELVFVGGSGGGFAALRISALFPGSAAFVFSPQTSIAKYKGGHFPRLLEHGYGIDDKDLAYQEFPGRFEVLATYSKAPVNRVYYLQNLNDPGHIGDHYNPLRRAIGISEVTGEDATGRLRLVLADLAATGHGPPAPEEFDTHWARALEHFAGHDIPAADGGPHAEDASSMGTAPTDESGPEDGAVGALSRQMDEMQRALTALDDFSRRAHRSHVREFGLLPWHIEAYKRLSDDLVHDPRCLPPVGSYALGAIDALDLVALVESRRPEHVLECGSGSSTAWMALALERAGRGHVTSLEHDAHYARRTRQLLEGLGVAHRVTLIDAPLGPRENSPAQTWYRWGREAELPDAVDLLLIDGPPGSLGRQIRYPALPVLWSRLHAESMIVVDDADRPEEKAVVERWLREFAVHRTEHGSSLLTLGIDDADRKMERPDTADEETLIVDDSH